MMNFEERKSIALRRVTEFLRDYVAPRGMDDESLARRITFCADAFARRMPTSGSLEEAIDAVLMRLRDTHASNTWPSQAEFIMAMPTGEVKKFAQLEQFKSEDTTRYSKLMNEGLAVAETAIWGTIASSLDVPRDVLASYRKSSAANWQKTYGRDAYQKMLSRYGPIVNDFFHAGAKG